jgi:HEAT repeat protein
MGILDKLFGKKKRVEEKPTEMSEYHRTGEKKLNAEELKKRKDVEGLIGALKYQGDGDIRADAAFALGDIETDERAVKPLIQALGDNYFAVVAGAAKSLGRIHDAAAVEPLIQVLLDSEALTARSNAAVALGEIKDTRAVEPLIQTLREDKTPEVRERAAWALRQIKDKKAIQPLIQAMRDDENWDVRGEATSALSDIGEPAVPFLIKALENDNDGIRGGAVLALGHIGDKRAIVPLRQALKDRSASIQDEASRAIRMIEQKTKGIEKEEGAEEEWEVYEDREYSVRYAHPSSWRMESYPTGGVGFSPPGEDINVALISGKSAATSLEDFVKNLKATFDDYVQRKLRESALDRRSSDFGLLSEKNTIVSGREAYILTWRIFSQGTSRIHTELCVLAGANRFRLQCIAPDGVYERYKDTVGRILESFVVVD